VTITFKLLATMVIWGGTFVSGRMLAQDMGSFPAAFLRFAAATAFLFLLVCRVEGRLPRLSRNMVLPALGLGLTGIFLYNAFFFTGLRQVAAGRASLIIAGQPAIIALLSAFFFREPLYPLKLAGIALALGGVGFGELCILGCTLSWSSYTLIGRKALSVMSPVQSVFWACVLGDLLLLPPALANGLATDLARSSLADWGNILVLGIMGTGVAFSWYSQGIQAIGASRAAVFINLVPVCAVAMGYAFLGEPVVWPMAAGAVLVLTGVWLTNRPVKRPSFAPSRV
jgi:drug/metabolite transporter (DMT)-like permease